MNRVPRWRIAAALLVIAALIVFGIKVGPIYSHNLELQNFVADLAAQPQNQSQSDDQVRNRVLNKARDLNLPVKPGDVKVLRAENRMRVDVRYVVRLDLPGYTVDLHFYPGAGSR